MRFPTGACPWVGMSKSGVCAAGGRGQRLSKWQTPSHLVYGATHMPICIEWEGWTAASARPFRQKLALRSPRLFQADVDHPGLENRLPKRLGARDAFQPERLRVAEPEDQVAGVVPGLPREHVDIDRVKPVQIDGLLLGPHDAPLDDDPPVGQPVPQSNAGENPQE